MTFPEQCATIGLCAAATMLTRFLPFLLFSSRRPTPLYVQYLGMTLPSAVFGLLIVYCLKDINLLTGTHGLPEFLGIAVTTALHLWKRQFLISMAGGTIFYMVLIRSL